MYTPPVYGTGVIGQSGAYKFVVPGGNGVRAKVSCVNCRNGKKKCDEGQPCTACLRSGRSDCVYECGPNNASRIGAPQPMASWTTPETSQSIEAAAIASRTAISGPTPIGNAPHNASVADPNIMWRNPLGAPSVTVLARDDGMPPMTRDKGSMQSQMQLQREMEAAENDLGKRDESPDPWFPRR
jgi:hypothetical protein